MQGSESAVCACCDTVVSVCLSLCEVCALCICVVRVRVRESVCAVCRVESKTTAHFMLALDSFSVCNSTSSAMQHTLHIDRT